MGKSITVDLPNIKSLFLKKDWSKQALK